MNNEINVSLPIKKVALYKHGMGYFERSRVDDWTKLISLSCSLEEIDDMLKSLIVVNEGGKPASITYQSSKPVLERLFEFGLDLKNNNGLLELLGQLKGAGVSLKADNQIVGGRILGIELEETTQEFYRFRVEVEKQFTSTLVVNSETQTDERVDLTNLDQIDKQFKWLINHEEAKQRARKNVKTLGATASRFQVVIEESEDKIVESNGKIADLNKNLTAKYQLLKVEAKQEFESIIKEAE